MLWISPLVESSKAAWFQKEWIRIMPFTALVDFYLISDTRWFVL